MCLSLTLTIQEQFQARVHVLKISAWLPRVSPSFHSSPSCTLVILSSIVVVTVNSATDLILHSGDADSGIELPFAIMTVMLGVIVGLAELAAAAVEKPVRPPPPSVPEGSNPLVALASAAVGAILYVLGLVQYGIALVTIEVPT